VGASIMVGDMETDRQFAQRAGIGTFIWADDFFQPRQSARELTPDG
jgi:histidinol phosphatase-like enzyme